MTTPHTTTACIVGGGPAGAMLGLLLARSGIDVVVLEKHGDFLRDFRDDTVHPTTLEVLDEIGLAEGFLALPHRKVQTLRFIEGGRQRNMIDTRLLDLRFPYIGRALPGRRGASPRDPCAPDRRRRRPALHPRDLGSSMDVVAFPLPREDGNPDEGFTMWSGHGHFVGVINRNTHWHIMYTIHKGGVEALRREGDHALHDAMANLVPFLAGRARELVRLDEVNVLDVVVNRVRGLLPEHVPPRQLAELSRCGMEGKEHGALQNGLSVRFRRPAAVGSPPTAPRSSCSGPRAAGRRPSSQRREGAWHRSQARSASRVRRG